MNKIKTIYADTDIASSPVTREILSHFSLSPHWVEDEQIVYKDILSSTDPISHGKEVLYLTTNKGAFIRNCPGTRHYHCCGYKILHTGTYCTMDCAYCILQQFFHPPVLKYFVNHEDMFASLQKNIFDSPKISRVGTGEYTDSLLWEPVSNLTPQLVSVFSSQQKAVLELKTKTVNIQKLQLLSHNRKTILAWSVNTPRVIVEEERHTTPLAARIEAAKKCQEWGYPIAFHFDPLLLYEGCEKEYENVVHQLFSAIRPENIAWISIGVFRFLPELKQIIEHRFHQSNMVYGEFISGTDGKMRYFKPLRMKVCKTIVDTIKQYADPRMAYFCMEDDEVWQYSFGYTPDQFDDIHTLLDERAKQICILS